MRKEERILVLGAGIVGASVAYHLTKAGYDVTVIERESPCAGASGACNGGLSYLGKTGKDLERAVMSLERYRSLSEDLGGALQIDQARNIILLGRAQEDEALLNRVVRAANERGLDAELLGEAALRRVLPAAKKGVRSAAVGAGGLQGVVNPFSATYAMLSAARERGARLQTAKLQSIEVSAGVARGVVAGGEFVPGDVIINCLGVDADALWKDLGIDLGIVPVQGVVLVTQPYPPLYPGNLLDANFLKEEQSDVSLALEQTMDGNLLIGASRARQDASREIPTDLPGRILRNAMRYVDGLESLSIIRMFAGIRPHRDAGPFIGGTQIQGLYAAVGFGGTGVTLAPYAGMHLTEIIREEL